MALSYPVSVKGQLGKRIDVGAERSRLLPLPGPQDARLDGAEGRPRPEPSLCLSLYPAKLREPDRALPPGSPNLGLERFQLDLPAGEYLLAMMQDRDAYSEAGSPPVYENISDDYGLELGPAPPLVGFEVEPNDAPMRRKRGGASSGARGALAWMRDVDVLCAKPTRGDAVFFVRGRPGATAGPARRAAGDAEVRPRRGNTSARAPRPCPEGQRPRRFRPLPNASGRLDARRARLRRAHFGAESMGADPAAAGRAGRQGALCHACRASRSGLSPSRALARRGARASRSPPLRSAHDSGRFGHARGRRQGSAGERRGDRRAKQRRCASRAAENPAPSFHAKLSAPISQPPVADARGRPARRPRRGQALPA